MKKLRYLIEAALVGTLIFIFGKLPLKTASALGGKILETIGPRLSVNRKAIRHIRDALDIDEEPARKISKDMWNNLGRTFAEYPHLETIWRDHIELIGSELLEDLEHSDRPALFFSGHLANWEIAGPCLQRHNIDLDLIYRAPNNRYVDTMLQRCRSMGGKLRTYPKSSAGMRQILNALKEGRRIGILIDQKYNQGVETEFFGRPAMTSPAYIQMAKRFKCPLYPARIERTGGENFRITIFPPLDLEKDEQTLLRESHDLLESWIKDRPGQWLWLHRRWKKQNQPTRKKTDEDKL